MSDTVLSTLIEGPAETWASASPARSHAKRALDLIVATAGLLLILPLLLVVAAAIRVDSSGPILFRQRRTGLGGQAITVLKFRTMRVMEDGEAVVQAQRHDVRVTRVGAFLRRSSIDELPQLINVIHGEMSLVGPRPHALAHDAFYSAQIQSYVQRFRAKPGITGLAQVSGLRGECATLDLMARRVERDLEYIQRWSIWRDLMILCRTAAVVPFQRAAYGLIGSAATLELALRLHAPAKAAALLCA